MRQTGRTTKQIIDAPREAVFVWCNEDLYYPKRIAQTFKRNDLLIVGPSWITNDGWRGLELSGIVIDHFTRFNMEEWTKYQEALTRVRLYLPAREAR